jgi:hypothetical protein
MRDLTKKQKKILDKWYQEQVDAGRTIGLFWRLDEDDNFSYELYEEIDEINPCEIVYQNVNNYIQEKAREDLDRRLA